MDDVKKILEDAGYLVVSVGYDETLQAIKNFFDGDIKKRCSGFKVFPNGEKCTGCSDCIKQAKEEA